LLTLAQIFHEECLSLDAGFAEQLSIYLVKFLNGSKEGTASLKDLEKIAHIQALALKGKNQSKVQA
jgi:hypothetical protein